MIFLFFKPLKLKEQHFVDVPQLELKHFTMYEFTPVGLQTYMLGASGTKYDDKFIVKGIDYTDKSPKYIANMQAQKGIYKNDIVTLEGNVTYSRDNGFHFFTQKLVYNKKTSQAVSNVGYTAKIGENKIEGTYIKYNNKFNRVYSKNIDAIYQLKEEKQ